MRLTTEKLRQLIKEELEEVVSLRKDYSGASPGAVSEMVKMAAKYYLYKKSGAPPNRIKFAIEDISLMFAQGSKGFDQLIDEAAEIIVGMSPGSKEGIKQQLIDIAQSGRYKDASHM